MPRSARWPALSPRKANEPGSCPAAPPAKNPGAWRNSANPIRSYTLLNHESPEYIRFVNPGDLRVNHLSCGTVNCHGKIVAQGSPQELKQQTGTDSLEAAFLALTGTSIRDESASAADQMRQVARMWRR